MTITKQILLKRLTEDMNMDKVKAGDVIEILLEIIKSTLESGDDIMISGFGKFSVNEKAVRKGRNPATGKDMMLPERRVVTFKTAGKLVNRINAR